MKKVIVFSTLCALLILSCTESKHEMEELEESVALDSTSLKAAGPIGLPDPDNIRLRMYFEVEGSEYGRDYAGIKISTTQKHPKEIVVKVIYWLGNYSFVFVPQEFRIPAYSYHSNKLNNVTIYHANTCGNKTIRMKIHQVYYGGQLITNYIPTPSSGEVSETLSGNCPLRWDHTDNDFDGVFNDDDNCPEQYGLRSNNGCP